MTNESSVNKRGVCNIIKHQHDFLSFFFFHDFLQKKIYDQYSHMMLFCDINCTTFHKIKCLDVIGIISNIGNTVVNI